MKSTGQRSSNQSKPESFLASLFSSFWYFNCLFRVRKNLKLIADSILVDIPTDKSFTLASFKKSQASHLTTSLAFLLRKNLEVETAVDDIIAAVTTHRIGTIEFLSRLLGLLY